MWWYIQRFSSSSHINFGHVVPEKSSSSMLTSEGDTTPSGRLFLLLVFASQIIFQMPCCLLLLNGIWKQSFNTAFRILNVLVLWYDGQWFNSLSVPSALHLNLSFIIATSGQPLVQEVNRLHGAKGNMDADFFPIRIQLAAWQLRFNVKQFQHR